MAFIRSVLYTLFFQQYIVEVRCQNLRDKAKIIFGCRKLRPPILQIENLIDTPIYKYNISLSIHKENQIGFEIPKKKGPKKKKIYWSNDKKKEYDLSKLKNRKNPFAKQLKK